MPYPSEQGKTCECSCIRIITRLMVIIRCVYLHKGRALRMVEFGDYGCCVDCLDQKLSRWEWGVPLQVKVRSFLDITGVCEARGLTGFPEELQEDSTSVGFTFEGGVAVEKVPWVWPLKGENTRASELLSAVPAQEWGRASVMCVGVRGCWRCRRDNSFF